MTTHAAPTTNITIKEQVKFKFADTKAVHEHLEYLGYTVEAFEDPVDDIALAKSPTKPTLTVANNQFWTKLVIRYGDYEPAALEDVEFFQALNEINKQTRYSTWFVKVEPDDCVVIVAFAGYRGYERVSFGDFVTTYEQECSKFVSTVSKWFKRTEGRGVEDEIYTTTKFSNPKSNHGSCRAET